VDRIGPNPREMRKLQEKDIFISRLQLLVVMSKAYLKDYPLGGYRAGAIKSNAAKLADAMTGWESYKKHFTAVNNRKLHILLDHILFQRIKLLLIMAISFAEGNPMGSHRKSALRNNIDYITDRFMFEDGSEPIPLLSVA